MSVAKANTKRITVKTLQSMADRGEKIAMLTAYDYSMATLVDMAGIDVVLVGDSAANVMAGYSTTLPITLNEMIYHASSVVRACKRAFIKGDRPFKAGHRTGDGNLYPWRHVLLLFRTVPFQQPARRQKRQPRALCPALPSPLYGYLR